LEAVPPAGASNLLADIEAVRALISRIDSAIANVDSVSDIELESILSDLATLENMAGISR
jgi:hypothetical protein